ncbi:MAG: flagellar basal body rod protein FlgB [Rhodocyclaceae bacterium]|nr:flagellar basal body rod protein FlgB [Rhodocyclaceae bacterium]
MIDRLGSEFQVKQTALNLRAYRQEMIASNIANGDTPHYKARDLDFKSALANAVGGKGSAALPVSRTASGHLDGAIDGAFAAEVRYRSEYQGAVDGNTVNMDVERGAFAENAVQMEALLSFIRDDFKKMQMAITGQ